MLPLETERLDRAADRPVLMHLKRADRLEGGVRPRAGTGRLPLRAVPGDEQDLAEPLVRLEPGVARPLSLPCLLRGPGAVEERGEHGIESAEGLLLGSARVASLPVRVSLADLLELRGLHAVGDTDLPHPPRLAALRQRGVVQVAVIGQQPHRAALLGPRRVGAELVGSSHLYRLRRLPPGEAACSPIVWPGTDISGRHAERRERGFAPSLKAGVPAAHL